MRSVTVIMRPETGALHPLEKQLSTDKRIIREAIHAVEPLDDGTIVMLTEIRGDLDRYRTVMTEATSVHEFAVSGDGSGYCYCRVDSSPLIELLVERQQTEDFVVEFPVDITDDGGYRITMVGREQAFVNAPSTPPDGIEMELVSMGPYHPHLDRPFAELTDRQHDVLETAIRLGYYQNPREATHEDIAEELGIQPSTVGKHLRSIEMRVFSKYVQ